MINAAFTEHFVFLKGAAKGEEHLLKDYLNAVPTKQGWRLPLNVHSMREIYKAFPHIVDHAFIAIGKDLAKPKLVGIFTDGINTKLRPYQREDSAKLAGLMRAAVFNDPRTGKTPTVLDALRLADAKRVLIVVPASLQHNWRREIEKWRPDVQPTIVKRTFPEGNGYFIVSRSVVHRIEIPKDFDTVVVDEAHFLRNFRTQQSLAVRRITAPRRYALTGTPAVNHPADVIGILMFLNPTAYPSYWQTVDRYFEVIDGHFSKEIGKVKAHRKAELQDVITGLAVQRKRKDVMPWLPKKQYTNIEVDMSTKQNTLYRSMQKTFLAELNDHEVDAQNVITQLIRLRQLALDPRLVGFTDVPGAKTSALLEYLNDHREPIVVMSWFTSYLKLIKPEVEKLGLKVGMIHGELTAVEKDRNAAAFQEGKTDVLLCNIVAAGTGFTLDRSGLVLCMDRAWTPAENEQAEDRVCPTTEANLHKHSIVDITALGTVEEKIHELLKHKKSITDLVNDMQAVRELVRR